MMHEGRVLASATPGEIVAEQGVASLEEAFIARIRAVTPPVPAATIQAWLPVAAVPSKRGAVRAAGRVWALIRKEGLETLRDRGRLLFSILVPPLLLLVYGFGYSFDIEGIPYAVADLDRSSASRSYLERFASSRAFSERAPASSAAELDSRLKSGEIKVAVEIPPGFGRDLRRGRDPGIGVWIDGTLPFRAEMARSYVEALHRTYLVEQDRSTGRPLTENGAGGIETRFRFNPAMKSAYAVVPGLFAVVLVIVPALLAGVAVARDRELGSIANLQATPVTRLEYFWSKQLVLVVMGVVGFFELAAMASTVFHVSLRGSLIACLAGTLLYVIATSALGLTISGLTRTQEAGLVGAAIITIIPAFMYSGLFRPVATLAGADALVARVFPAAYYRSVTVGTFTKGLEIGPFVSDYLALALIGLCLTLTGVAVLRKQAR
jgi:ribosome-dependent ATPase